MSNDREYRIITFYEFRQLGHVGELSELRDRIRFLMKRLGIVGTMILAEEGYNATVCGTMAAIPAFLLAAEDILQTSIKCKSSFADEVPFRRIDVKVKPEIVTLKKEVDISAGKGTHVSPIKWNELLNDENIYLLDTRNDYEYQNGTFRNAVNPGTSKFSELAEFVENTLDPAINKKIALFCTGGIRCEKFAPYLKQKGFDEVYQLDGGILRYLEEMPRDLSLWEGECFVFDNRITVDENLETGTGPDYSQNST